MLESIKRYWSSLVYEDEVVAPAPAPINVNEVLTVMAAFDNSFENKLSQAKVAAANMIGEVIADQPMRLAHFQSLHDEDNANYSFDCRAHGDFLALFVSRNAFDAALSSDPDGEAYKRIIGINLKNAKFELKLGSAPKTDAVVSFRGIWQREEGKAVGGSGCHVDYLDAIKMRLTTSTFKGVRPDYPHYHTGLKPIYVVPDTVNGCISWGGGDWETYGLEDIKVTGIARPAEDDTIAFSNGDVLKAPAGRGEIVFAQMLKALGRRGS
jgi:hypothetical protein